MKFVLSFLFAFTFLLPVHAYIASQAECDVESESDCRQQLGCKWIDWCEQCTSGNECTGGNTSQCPSGFNNGWAALHKIHPAGASSCSDFICESGYIQSGNDCILNCTLTDGYYLPAGATSCNDWQCDIGWYRNQDRTACVQCPPDAITTGYDSENISQCQCPKDSYMNNGACVSCPDGAETENTGATNISQCQCPAGSRIHYTNGVWDFCFTTNSTPNTYTYDQDTHTFDCITYATYNDSGANVNGVHMLSCTCPLTHSGPITNGECTCDEHSHMSPQADGTYACVQCDNNAQPSGTQCKCNADYYGNGHTCTHCPDNSTTDGLTGKQNVTDCKCGKGYYDTPTATIPVNCAICPAGSTTTGIGAIAISECKMTSNTLFCDGNGQNCMNLIPNGVEISASAN